MTAVAHHGNALQYASAPSEHCTDNELNTVQLDAQHGQRRPHRRNARQRKLHFAAAPFQRGRYTMHKMDEMVSGPVRARGSWGSVKAAEHLRGQVSEKSREQMSKGCRRVRPWPAHHVRMFAETDVRMFAEADLGPVRARGSPRPSGRTSSLYRRFFLNAQINDGCPICLKGIAHLYVTLGCDYREHLTPTPRRARQDGPPQRSLPATFHNAIFRTAYLSSS